MLGAGAGVEPLSEPAVDLLLVGVRVAAPEIEPGHLDGGLEQVEGEAHAVEDRRALVGVAGLGLARHCSILSVTCDAPGGPPDGAEGPILPGLLAVEVSQRTRRSGEFARPRSSPASGRRW